MVSGNDKARFCYDMARHTQATFAQCQKLLRLAATLHRFDVERCNRPETEAHKRKIVRLQTQVSQLAGEIHGLTHMPGLTPRESNASGYMDSDRDWLEGNRDWLIPLMESAASSETSKAAFTWEPMACALVLAVPDGYSDQTGEPKGIGVPA